MDFETKLKESFGGNIDKAKDSLTNHINKCLIEVIQNMSDITINAETDQQRFILVNSLVLSVMVNIAKFKLNNEISTVRCGYQDAQLSRDIYLMNKCLFENTANEIQKELEFVLKNRTKLESVSLS
jgi:hypothetical protein